VHLQSIRLQEGNYTAERIGNQRIPSKSTIIKVIKKLRLAYQKRADQARRVVAHASNSPYPSVICGDFNDTPMSYCYNQFNRKYIDAFRNSAWGIGSTYIGRLPAGRIDYIFHTPTLNSSEFQVHSEKLSDHRAISCKIEKL
jgi:endonuclease/exonuclease/phosphatase family metal-dependent hydrolase